MEPPDTLSRRAIISAAGGTTIAGVAGCVSPRSRASRGPLVGPDGEQVSLKLVYPTGSETTKTTAQYIKQEYEAMGIDLQLNGIPFNSLLRQYAENSPPGSEQSTFNAGNRDESISQDPWDIIYGVRFNTYPRTPTSIRSFWVDERNEKEATANFFGYRPSVDISSLLDQATASTSPEERQSVLARIFGVLSEDQPCNFIMFQDSTTGLDARIAGMDIGPSFGYNSQQWYFQGANAPAVRGSYTSGASTGPTSLNPVRINDAPSSARVGLTMDATYTFDNDVNFVSRQVESIESDENRVWEVTLRDNLRWSEEFGDVTAEDWVYYIKEVHQAPDNWAGDVNYSSWWIDEEPIPVEKTGTYSFVVRLPEPDAFFPKKPILWGAWCLPKGLVKPYRDASDGRGLNQDDRILNLSYTGNLGPYSFVERVPDSRFVAERNEDYYLRDDPDYADDIPYFEDQTIQIFNEESTRLNALEEGEITESSLPPDKVSRFRELESIQVVQVNQPFCTLLVYNQRSNGWSHLRKRAVRQALGTGVGKQTVVQDIHRDIGEVAHTFQPSYSEWYDSSEVREYGVRDAYDHQVARDLLVEALPDGYEYESSPGA